MIMAQGTMRIFLERPIALAFFALAVIFMLIPWMLRRLRVAEGIETEDA
jgi:TctA family transporter